MNKGQGVSSSCDAEEEQPLHSEDEESPPHGSTSSMENTSSGSDPVSTSRMKRSQAFNCSFSLEEDQHPLSQSEVQTQPPTRSGGIPELVQSEPSAQCTHASELEAQSSQSGLFRPQDLWLTVTRCLSIRWPPCLSLNILDRSNRKLPYQKDCNQSQKSFSSDSLDSANPSISATSTSSEDINVTLVKKEKEEEGAKTREVKRCPTSRWGVSRSSPRLPRDRQAADLLLASMILEREMFLTVELIDRGEEEHDLRYQAEWKLSERNRQLAAGVWLSRTRID